MLWEVIFTVNQIVYVLYMQAAHLSPLAALHEAPFAWYIWNCQPNILHFHFCMDVDQQVHSTRQTIPLSPQLQVSLHHEVEYYSLCK
jgi:hypothetical protein